METTWEQPTIAGKRIHYLVDEFFIVIPEPFPSGGIQVRLWLEEGMFTVMANLCFKGELEDQYSNTRSGSDPSLVLGEFLMQMQHLVEREPVERIRAFTEYFPEPEIHRW